MLTFPGTLYHEKGRVMKTMKKILDRIDELLSCLFLLGMCTIIAVQVFTRYVLGFSLDWSEELGRYLFIWSVYIGCSYAMKADRHLEITFVRHFWGGKYAKPATLMAYSLSVVFNLICLWFGTKMILFLMQTGQNSAAMEVKMYWVYLAIPLGMGMMALRTIERMIKIYKHEELKTTDDASHLFS